MSRLRIDLVAPPFHGHLHPILGVAQALQPVAEICLLSTIDARTAAQAAGVPFAPVIERCAAEVWAVANPPQRVGGNPVRLWHQLEKNLSLLPELHSDLTRRWTSSRPNMVIVDFCLPTVGALARRHGIAWWTSCPSPVAIETRTGTPGYLGGWPPPKSVLGRVRDAAGRRLTRAFKHAVFQLLRPRFARLGIDRLYRPDDTEAAYSDEMILALGCRELEFQREWPAAVRFVGPMLFTPPGGEQPRLDPVRKNVLVTIGTHLPHVRRDLERNLQSWAQSAEEIAFHLTLGGTPTSAATGNFERYSYLSYSQHLHCFDAVVHHGGSGITHHALAAGVPSVVWPQDYDQFDFAARLSAAGAAIRCAGADEVPAALKTVLGTPDFRRVARHFAQLLRDRDPAKEIRRLFLASSF